MGLWQGDVILKTAIELMIDDIKKDPWLIEDIFSDLLENPYLKEKYGMKEIQRAKDFLLNNRINLYMQHRLDSQNFPCVTISEGAMDEDKSLATLADQSEIVDELEPDKIGKPISFIVNPFDVVSYDQTNGIVEMPSNSNFKYISTGMFAVDPDTGNGYEILGKSGKNKFKIEAGVDLDVSRLAIVPKYQVYRARRERIVSQTSYTIGCHCEGDPGNLIFIFNLVKYGLLRYREGLFEFSQFELSTIKCTDMVKNDAFGKENVYSRFIVLSGQVVEDWIKSPFRIIEAADIKSPSEDEINLTNVGIKVISNKNTIEESEEAENDLWVTIDDE
jgi:hypothetical protein